VHGAVRTPGMREQAHDLRGASGLNEIVAGASASTPLLRTGLGALRRFFSLLVADVTVTGRRFQRVRLRFLLKEFASSC
jgi:hypothetical protein